LTRFFIPMALRVEPFQGLCPAGDLVAEVVCRPGALDHGERLAQTADNPFSLLHIEHAEVDLESGTLPFSEAACRKARTTLDAYVAQEILVPEAVPCVYLYRLKAGEREQTGIAITCALDDLPTDDPQGDAGEVAGRARLITALNAQTSPVVLTYPESADLDALSAEVVKIPPLYDFTTPDGVAHTLWRVPGEALGAFFIRAFADVPGATIVEGAAQAAAMAQVRRERREADPSHTGKEPWNRALALFFPRNRWNAFCANGTAPALQPLSGLFIHRL